MGSGLRHELLTCREQYLLVSMRTIDRPVSENRRNAALRLHCYQRRQMRAHGLRTMSGALLTQVVYNPERIERQLVHVEIK